MVVEHACPWGGCGCPRLLPLLRPPVPPSPSCASASPRPILSACPIHCVSTLRAAHARHPPPCVHPACTPLPLSTHPLFPHVPHPTNHAANEPPRLPPPPLPTPLPTARRDARFGCARRRGLGRCVGMGGLRSRQCFPSSSCCIVGWLIVTRQRSGRCGPCSCIRPRCLPRLGGIFVTPRCARCPASRASPSPPSSRGSCSRWVKGWAGGGSSSGAGI